MTAVDKYGVPSRMRVDKGGENYRVSEYMIEQRGCGRRTVIAGRSVHNQRIERFWRDVRREVINYYRELFDWFITDFNDLLDMDNPRDIFCLHYLFLPRINQDLLRFQERWNNHKLKSEHHQSPYELLMFNDDKSGAAVAHVDDDDDEVDSQYGDNESDHDGDSDDHDNEEDLPPQVVLEPMKCPLTPEQYELFGASIVPFTLQDTNQTQFANCLHEAIELYDNIINAI